MWNRACPLCFTKVPRALVLTRMENLACPSCHAPLELSRPSKVLGAMAGLLAGIVGFRVAFGFGEEKWVVSMVAAVFGYGLGSVLALLVLSDLVVRPKPSPGNFPHTHG